MTDLSPLHQSKAPAASLTYRLRLTLKRLKHHLRSRREEKIDLRSANSHFLRDVGLRR